MIMGFTGRVAAVGYHLSFGGKPSPSLSDDGAPISPGGRGSRSQPGLPLLVAVPLLVLVLFDVSAGAAAFPSHHEAAGHVEADGGYPGQATPTAVPLVGDDAATALFAAAGSEADDEHSAEHHKNVAKGIDAHHNNVDEHEEQHHDEHHKAQNNDHYHDHHVDVEAHVIKKQLVQASIYYRLMANEDVRTSVLRSLANKDYGPLVLRPAAHMLCLAIAEADDNDRTDMPTGGCDIAGTVTALQDAMGELDPDNYMANLLVFYNLMDRAIKVLTGADDHDSHEEPLEHLQQALMDSFSANSEETEAFPILEKGLMKICIDARAKMTENATNAVGYVPRASLLQGFIRLFLSDRDLERAVFQAVCDDVDLVVSLAANLHNKYGVVTIDEGEEIIHEMLSTMLNNWDSRQAVFEALKSGFSRLTGKMMPLTFFLYDRLVQGIKFGEIELPAIMGYMELAKISPDVIRALAAYDTQAFNRFKYLYVPAYKFIRDFMRDPYGAQFVAIEA